MSIVGTRPPLISETNLYELHHRAHIHICYKNFRILLYGIIAICASGICSVTVLYFPGRPFRRRWDAMRLWL